MEWIPVIIPFGHTFGVRKKEKWKEEGKEEEREKERIFRTSGRIWVVSARVSASPSLSVWKENIEVTYFEEVLG